MSVFRVFVAGGNSVAWLPDFDTRGEAEARVNEIGEAGGWDERVEIVEIFDERELPAMSDYLAN